jgi:hypothetical protein
LRDVARRVLSISHAAVLARSLGVPAEARKDAAVIAAAALEMTSAAEVEAALGKMQSFPTTLHGPSSRLVRLGRLSRRYGQLLDLPDQFFSSDGLEEELRDARGAAFRIAAANQKDRRAVYQQAFLVE